MSLIVFTRRYFCCVVCVGFISCVHSPRDILRLLHVTKIDTLLDIGLNQRKIKYSVTKAKVLLPESNSISLRHSLFQEQVKISFLSSNEKWFNYWKKTTKTKQPNMFWQYFEGKKKNNSKQLQFIIRKMLVSTYELCNCFSSEVQ